MSVRRSVQPLAARRRARLRPRLPLAPVSRMGRSGVSGMGVGSSCVGRGTVSRACPRVNGAAGSRHADDRPSRRRPRSRAHHRAQAGGALPRARSRRRRARARATFVRVYAEQARASADAMDAAAPGRPRAGPLAGIPISVKDLFDVAGERTAAGSQVLARGQAGGAACDRVAARAGGRADPGRAHQHDRVRLLRASGINPHFGTPRSPWQRDEGAYPGRQLVGGGGVGRGRDGAGRAGHGHGRLLPHPGGVLRHRRLQADGAAGADRRACCRCRRRSTASGRSPTRVACCAAIDAVLAGEPPAAGASRWSCAGCGWRCRATWCMEGMEPAVAEAFSRALNRLGNLGVRITHLTLPAIRADRRGQRDGRVRGGGGVCLAPRVSGRPGRGLRSAGPRAHRARARR